MVKHIVWPALMYFTLVFVVGFVLGVVRVLLLVPRLGERYAELLELPLMVLASFLAARWVIGWFKIDAGVRSRLAVGFLALSLMLAAELIVMFFVQRVSLSESVAARDPVSGSAYLLSLVSFALMPWMVRRNGDVGSE